MPVPQGTISFLFTDIVGSTRLWEKFPNIMGEKLARHDALLHEAVTRHGGHVFKTVGDAFCVAFETPVAALLTAIDAQHALAGENWGEIGPVFVRMGIHTGVAEFRDNDYFGSTLNRVARIESAAHGGQILLSQVSVELLGDEDIESISFKSLGNHRLRNLDRPEHLFQVVADGLKEAFPAPKSMEVLPNNLPAQATSFIGREREMEDIQNLLEKNSLITLMGTGGTGKTRLSVEVGARVINKFPGGVWQVELAPVPESSRVAEVIASVLGVREEPDRSLRDSLVNFLRGKLLLLILDNCEHLLPGIAPLISDLLRNCPRLKILATSRQTLGVAGERIYTVPPLGILDVRLQSLTGPDIVQRLSQFDAVKLFIERAAAVRPDFRVTNENAPALAEICSRLDGIPLAIELAAARVRVLDLNQIALRLKDRFRLLRNNNSDALPHQQTLQALIDWSYDLLSESERILFRRLGVFVGGRTLESLEAVCAGDGIDEFEILDLLQQLIDKSLVSLERDKEGDPRYTITESVWHYSREKMEASGEAVALRTRHLDYFLRWAEEAATRMEGPQQKVALEEAHREYFNFRAAADWAVRSGQSEKGLRMVAALYRLIEVRGNIKEALDLINDLITRSDDGVSPGVRAKALIAVGRLCWAMDRYDEARKHYTEALALYQGIADEKGAALAEMLTAFLDRGDEDPESAERRFLYAADVGRRSNSLFLLAGSQSGLGSLALDRGDLVEARRLKEESLTNYERLGDHWIVGLILWGIAKVAIAQRDYARARAVLDQWARITRDLHNGWILPYLLDGYGELEMDSGDPAKAARYFGAAEGLREHFGARFSPREQSENDGLMARLKSLVPADVFSAEWETGKTSSPWDILDLSREATPAGA